MNRLGLIHTSHSKFQFWGGTYHLLCHPPPKPESGSGLPRSSHVLKILQIIDDTVRACYPEQCHIYTSFRVKRKHNGGAITR